MLSLTCGNPHQSYYHKETFSYGIAVSMVDPPRCRSFLDPLLAIEILKFFESVKKPYSFSVNGQYHI